VRFCSGVLHCAIARSATHNRVTPFVLYMALTFSVVDTWDDENRIHVSGLQMTPDAAPFLGGDTLTTASKHPKYQPGRARQISPSPG
jgi:hypothetical protein